MRRVLFTIFFTGIGLAISLFAGYLALQKKAWLEHTLEAEGVVLRFEESHSTHKGRTTTFRHPVVSFIARDGTKHEFTHQAATNPPEFSVGERVPVVYEPGTYEATIKNFRGLYGFETFLGVFSLCFFVPLLFQGFKLLKHLLFYGVAKTMESR